MSGIRERFIVLISPHHKVENKHVSSEKLISEDALAATTPPVSSNIKLFILIKWKIIEMSVNVVQQKAIEILCKEVFSLTTHGE